MPNVQQIELLSRKLEKVNQSIKLAERMMDKKAVLEWEGKREVLSHAELCAIADKTTLAIQACA